MVNPAARYPELTTTGTISLAWVMSTAHEIARRELGRDGADPMPYRWYFRSALCRMWDHARTARRCHQREVERVAGKVSQLATPLSRADALCAELRWHELSDTFRASTNERIREITDELSRLAA